MMDNLLSGLLGAVIGGFMGGVVALVAAGRQIRASQGQQRRETLTSVVADFWGACDSLWEAKRALGYTILEIQIDRTLAKGRAIELEEQRQANFVRIADAERDARRALALIRLLFDDLLEPATDAFEASRAQFKIHSDSEPMQIDVDAVQREAMATFESHVSQALANG